MSGDARVNRLGQLLSVPYQALTQRLLAALAQAGFGDLRSSHLALFRHLQPDGSRVTELAQHLRMTKPSVVYLVNDLEDRGYVERLPDPSDRRAVLVRRTERGRNADRTVQEVTARVVAEWTRALGEVGTEQLLTNLERLVESIRDGRDSGRRPRATGSR